ncbi:class I tRNA ligase family protein [Mycoplasmopsis iners]|uniref:class I tRNA ligase family protein n=1 Tax=Mycoplasmopsis iners TaxID=76630 RepID=UPI000497CAF6|nr:class I tRNA ligase family protein [Mycoplasmopsis iners]
MQKNDLKVYVCGPTVYNFVHIGNMRPILTYDFILKGFRELGTNFTFIHNITDIDDKIINKAIAENKTEKEISEFYTQKYLELLNLLNVDTITHIEKVTDNLNLIIEYIQKMRQKQSAYFDDEGNVWFDVKKNEKYYGEVSKQNLNNMEFSDDLDYSKHFKADFALWKKTTKGVKYDSPFGLGRPGWHTECSALIAKHFGDLGVDFHGGGMDLTFPHHENENIQNRAIYDKPLANQWLRTGQINLDGIKMSKSLGNIILASDFIEKYGSTVLKLIILSSKITAPINVTDELISNMQSIEHKYKKLIFKYYTSNQNHTIDKESIEFKEIMKSLSEQDFAKYNFLLNSLIKDFNKTADAKYLKIIFAVLSTIHKELTEFDQYKDSIELFNQWTYFIGKKEFEQADKIRAILMEKHLI